MTNVWIGENLDASLLIDQPKRGVAAPQSGGGISAMRDDRKFRLRVAGVRDSVHVEPFDKYFGRDEELHRAKNAAVVGEVAGTASREHVLVKGVIDADDERIWRSRVDEMRNIDGKGGVAFARMLASELPVHPHRGCVEYGGKLNANGGASPAFGNVEFALIPSDASIFDERRVNLPGVRNGDGNPIVRGGLCC